jgi:hypothetical protein
VKALAFVALGAALAYTVAIVALTDWLEIDWSFKSDEKKPLARWDGYKPGDWKR